MGNESVAKGVSFSDSSVVILWSLSNWRKGGGQVFLSVFDIERGHTLLGRLDEVVNLGERNVLEGHTISDFSGGDLIDASDTLGDGDS